MKNLILLLAAVILLAIQTPGDPAPKAVAHVYIAYRCVPYFGEATAAQGMIILDADDGEGRKIVVGIPPALIEQIVSFSKKQAISYVGQ